MQQVTFFSMRTTHVTLCSDTNTNNNGGRREVCIVLARNTFIILSLCQLKMRILRFIVHSVLATKYYQASKNNVKFEETFGVTAQLSLQSKSHQVVFSRELRAKPQPQLLQAVLHYPNNKSWTLVQNK